MKKWKKIIAPLIITILLCAYMVYYMIASIGWGLPFWSIALGVGIPLIFITLCIFALIERVKEIRSGEEDDLSKY